MTHEEFSAGVELYIFGRAWAIVTRGPQNDELSTPNPSHKRRPAQTYSILYKSRSRYFTLLTPHQSIWYAIIDHWRPICNHWRPLQGI